MARTRQTNREGIAIPLTKTELGRAARRGIEQGVIATGHGGSARTFTFRCPLVGPGWSDRHDLTGYVTPYEPASNTRAKAALRAVTDHLDPENVVVLAYGPDGAASQVEHVCPAMRPVVRTA